MRITIAHLYPELLNLYSDRGNIIALKKRVEWRGIECEILEIESGQPVNFSDYDIVFLGGGSDREQEIVGENLMKLKDGIKGYVDDSGVVIAICGGYQLLGNYYQMGGSRVEGLGILNISTEINDKRMIGNVAIQTNFLDHPVVGFENHGGATKINEHTPLGKVIFGFGNNGEDCCEGVRFMNVFGTYLHGPLLPKNPHFCDYILQCAIARKDPSFELSPLDDQLEWEANGFILKNRGTLV